MLSAIIFVLTVFFSGSHQQCFTGNDTTRRYVGERYSGWIDSRNDFSVSLFRLLNEENRDKNVFFSPSSVHELLLLAYFGAAHETEESLAKVLHKPLHITKSEALHFFEAEKGINYGHEGKQYPLKVANKIFFSNKLNLRPCILKYLGSETQLIDFQTNVLWAQHYINSWASNVTEGEIKEPVKDLSQYSTMVLLNAVYFKAAWKKGFKTTATTLLPFHMSQKLNRHTEMMTTTDFFPVDHLDEINARVLKMTYDGDKQAMYILLPHDDLDSMIKRMTLSVIRIITSTDFLKRSKKVEVVVPKYESTIDLELNNELRKLGIGNALTKAADLSRFTGEKNVYFDHVTHQAAIKVDEKGTTSETAENVADMTESDRISYDVKFICNRPFAYFIYDYVKKTILFMGTYRIPSNLPRSS